MAIVFQCEGCGKGYEVSDGLAGKKGRCKACGHSFRIPTPGEAPADVYGIEDALPEDEPLPPQMPSRTAEPAASGFGLKPAAPKAKPKRVDEENQAQFRAVGVKFLIAGVLVFLLPFIGLQIKGLHLLGPVGQMIGGVVLLGIGGACFVVSFTARPMRSMGLAILGIIGVVGLFIVIVGPAASRRRQAALAGAPAPIDAPAPPRFAPPAPMPIPAPMPPPGLAQGPDFPAPPTIPPPNAPPGPPRIRKIPRVGERPGARPAGPLEDEPFKVTIRNVKIGPDERFPNVPNRMGVEFDYTFDEGDPPVRPLTLVLDSATTRNGRVPLVHLQARSGHFAGHVLIPQADKGPFDCYLGHQKIGPGGLSFDAVSNVAKGEWGP